MLNDIGIAIYDAECRLLWASHWITPHSSREAGKKVWEFLKATDAPRVRNSFARCLAFGSKETYEASTQRGHYHFRAVIERAKVAGVTRIIARWQQIPCELAKLTPRERTVCLHIGRGMAIKQIASKLRIAPATARTHRWNSSQKIGLSGEAMVVWCKEHLAMLGG